MRTSRQFRPFLDRLPYRITPGDISTIQGVVPPPSDGDGTGDDGSGSCANPGAVPQPTAPLPAGSSS
jgi:hypothetical protein